MKYFLRATGLLALAAFAAALAMAKAAPYTLQFSGSGQVTVDGKPATSGMSLPRNAVIAVSGGKATLTVRGGTIVSADAKFRLSGRRLKCLSGTMTFSTPAGTQTLAAGQSTSLPPENAPSGYADSGPEGALPAPPPPPTAQQNVQAGLSSSQP